MSRFTALPSQNELAEMKEDLAFKEGEMKKSEQTSMGLAQGKLTFLIAMFYYSFFFFSIVSS